MIEATQIPKNVVSSIPTLEFNGLFDGQVVYQLGVIGELKDQGVGKYQTLAKRYPAHLESDLATKVTATSERAISQQDTPGLYQVLYQVDGDAEGVHEDVSPLTAPDIAFMTKVFDAIYRAHFPYADYHLTNQKSAPATVIGAQIERANKGSEQ